MKTALLIAFICVFLTGCPSNPKLPEEQVMKAGLVTGALKAAEAPLFEMTCPPNGCIISSLKVGNPNSGAQLAEVVKVAMTPETSTNEKIALAFIDKGFGALGIGLIANGAKSILGNMFASQTAVSTGAFNALSTTAQSGFGATAVIAGRIPQPGAVTTTTTNTTNTTTTLTASGAGSAVASGGNATGNNPISTTTSTVTNTNPTPRVCTPTYSSTGVPTGFNCTGG